MIKRLSKLCFSIATFVADAARDVVRRLAGRQPVARRVILYYHAIKAAQRTRFARQMELVKKHAHPCRLDADHGPETAGSHVAVTFDDAFVSVVENAAPILREKNIPYTIFVPSGSLGTRPTWVHDPRHPSWEERVMTRDELKALVDDSLATIGSHSVTHPNFLRLSRDVASEEFRRSKSDLEEILNSPVQLFSFPHGAHNRELIEQARATGYTRLFTIEPALAPDPGSEISGRFLADPEDWPLEFRLKIAGAYRWESAVRKLRGRRTDSQ